METLQYNGKLKRYFQAPLYMIFVFLAGDIGLLFYNIRVGAVTGVFVLLYAVVVLVLSAIAVIIIGPVSYVGLMVPHIVRYFVGTDYRLILPSCAVLGAVLVVFVDFLARVLIAPLEFPVGILITIIGVPFFIFISRRQKSDAFSG